MNYSFYDDGITSMMVIQIIYISIQKHEKVIFYKENYRSSHYKNM